ncbi:hypothetical protein CCR75_004679 [Bremia lactucae]|uniref:Uncharacterized protein n=1 Tax=Bremia lactucae TaxID=4779 RepID=A0A976FQP0_BRELC|nr:hypothetical protein CCR75_004679 [Bremia lactucae]
MTLGTTSFSLASWKSHQKTEMHNKQMQIYSDNCSQPPKVTSSSESSVYCTSQSLATTQETSLELQVSQDHQSLILIKRDVHQNKQQLTRYERDVTNVINAMTNLVSDQQKDMDALQLLVHDMRTQIEGLKKKVDFFRAKNRSKNAQEIRRPTSILSQSFPANYVLSMSPQNYERRYQNSQRVMKDKTRSSMSEMDMFEKRFRLA